MREYELALVIDPSLDEEAVAALVAQMTELITKQHGTVATPKVWGKKPLAYPVDEKTEGSYVFIPFSSEPPALNEIYRVLRYNQQVLRHLVVHAVPESPEMAPRVVTRKVETFVPPGKLRQNAEQAVAVTTAERPDITLAAKEPADAAAPPAEPEATAPSAEPAVETEPEAPTETAAKSEPAEVKAVARTRAAAKPKAEPKEKAGAKPRATAKAKAEAKEKAEPKPKAAAKAKPEAKKSQAPKEKAPAKATRKVREPAAKAAKK